MKKGSKKTALAKVERKPPAKRRKIEAPAVKGPMTDAEIISAFDVMGITKKLNDEQAKLFLAVAKEFRLNPLRREIHAVSMGEEGASILVPVVGYEVYIDRAEATGRLEYWTVEESGEVNREDWRKSTFTCTLIAKRRDWPKEFRWPVRYVESVGLKWNSKVGMLVPNSMWMKRPTFMTRKCAIGQGLRELFRDVLRGMPYIDAEMQYQDNGEQPEERPVLQEPKEKVFEIGAETPAALPAPEKPAPESDPYAEIMSLISSVVRVGNAKVPVFGGAEKLALKAKADAARGSAEDIAKVLNEVMDLGEDHKQKIVEAQA